MNPFVGCRVEYRAGHGIVITGVVVEREWNESQMMPENRIHWDPPSGGRLYEWHTDAEIMGNPYTRPLKAWIFLVPNGVEVMVELCD